MSETPLCSTQKVYFLYCYIVDKVYCLLRFQKSQIALPADVRELLNLRPGTRVRFVVEKDAARILPAEGGIETLKGAVKVSALQDFKAARHKAMDKRSREKSAHPRR